MNLIATDRSATLAAIHAQAFERPWSEAEFATLLRGPGVFALLAETGEPIGMVLCRTVAEEAEILTLAVLPSARRNGVADGLVRAACDLAQRGGADAMLLEVGVANVAATCLYRRLGFAEVGRRKAYYDHGPIGREDALVLRLDLKSPAR